MKSGSFLVVDDGSHDRISDIISRDDADLIAIVREMGAAANGESAKLRIVEVERYIEIESHDGFETV